MSPLRLVLVDDNPDDRAFALRALRQERPDLSVLEVVDEAAFARILAGPSHDLVLSDYELHWTNGLEVLRAVKQRWPTCPVIFFTGTGSEEIAVEAMKSGLDDYVIKTPAHYRRLPAAVRSALQRAEERASARAGAERMRLLLESVPDCIKTMDSECRLLQMNMAGLRMIEAGEQDVRGKSLLELILPEHREAFRSLVQRVFRGETGSLEFELEGLKGQRRWVFSQLVPMRDPDGTVREAMGVTLDLTERRAAEQTLRQRERELRQAQKLEALGRLAGGVAHDFNNLLTGILGFSELVLRTLGESDKRREQLMEIQRAGKRAATLTRQLLAFSRHQEFELAVFDLNALVRGLSSMLTPLIGEQIEIAYELQPELGRVRADRGQLELVLLNLALNARDAMPGGGTLEIRTRNLELDEQAARDRGLAPGSFVCLEVLDDGCGMTPEILDRIFEPFFTTKPVGKGTGLGLSTAHGIVEQSGGHISVASVPGKGSTFTVLLPRAEAGLEAPRPAPSSEGASLGGKTVLVVEDEKVVLELIQAVLRSSGSNVLAASSPEEALRLCREHEGAIDLCLIDVIMPGLSGPEAMAQMSALRPGMKALFMSGHSKQAFSRAGLEVSDLDLLPKPFAPSDLVARVRQALER